MSQKHKRPRYRQAGRRIALENVKDTAATTVDPLSDQLTKGQRSEDYEKIDPPFRASPTQTPFIRWDQISPTLRLIGGVVLFFSTFILPAVWYASKLDSNVDTLKTDVRDVKQRTEELVKNSIQHGERLDSLEKSTSTTNESRRKPAAVE